MLDPWSHLALLESKRGIPMNRTIALALAVLASLAAVTSSYAQDPAPYHAAKTVALGSPDRWDYHVFDGLSQLYVSRGSAAAGGIALGDTITTLGGFSERSLPACPRHRAETSQLTWLRAVRSAFSDVPYHQSIRSAFAMAQPISLIETIRRRRCWSSPPPRHIAGRRSHRSSARNASVR
jgi:hypothetical protein